MTQLWRHRDPLRLYLANMHAWFLDGYMSSVDEAVAVLFAVTLLAALLLGVRAPALIDVPVAPPAPDRLWASRLPLAAGLLGAGYFVLPMSITQPVGWWAVNVRLLVPFILMLGLLVPVRRRGLPSWALGPLWAAATLYGLYITQDFRRWWMRVELRGFDAALQAIPVGETVHAIYPAFEGERHYRHFPMGHIVDWYVADRGGTATPWMTSHPREVWVTPRPRPAAYWGLQDHFIWERHGVAWNYFLVKQPAPGNSGAYVPFRNAPAGAVTRVFESGLWSVWKRTL